MPTTPYVSAAAFTAHPTYLDVSGLRPGNPDPAAQAAALTEILLEASAWADNICDQPLGVHTWTQRCRGRVSRGGNLVFRAEHGPVLSVSTVGYGSTPTALTTVSGAGAWVENQSNVTLPLTGGTVYWSGSLQFGMPTSDDVWIQAVLTAGHVATILGADATAGSTSLTVADPTGILPGAQYRIAEPGAEETITVSSTWTPGSTTVALVAATARGHTAGSDFSGLPADARLGVIQYAAALLMRPDSTAEDEFPDTKLATTTRSKDSRKKGTGLIAEATRTLSSFARIG
mgnify:CR=1 FL=1